MCQHSLSCVLLSYKYITHYINHFPIIKKSLGHIFSDKQISTLFDFNINGYSKAYPLHKNILQADLEAVIITKQLLKCKISGFFSFLVNTILS